MKFRYSFQKIVDLKSNEKTQAEWVLSSAVGTLRREEETLGMLYSEKSSVESQLDSATAKATASELMIYQQYLEHLDNKIIHKKSDVRHAENKVTEKRQILTGKMVEEKVWDQARSKAFQLYKGSILKKEQDDLDEIATTRYKVRS